RILASGACIGRCPPPIFGDFEAVGCPMRSRMIRLFGFSLSIVGALASAIALAPAARGGQASVLDVTAVANEDGTYGFNVAVSHADEGWKHYADRWDVIGP